jgi:hypothetical protein
MLAAAAHEELFATGIREVTDEEVRFYLTHGWVKLDGLVSPILIEELLARTKRKMGENAEHDKDNRGGIVKGSVAAIWRFYEGLSEEDEFAYGLTHSQGIARVASRLLRDRAVRFYSDEVACKMPAAQGGGKTPWHQDFPYHPFDRAGVMNFWFALVDCPPEKGTMRFLNGSHGSGPWGRYIHRTDGVDLVDDNPWVREMFDISPPLHLKPGDATVHDRNLIHCAPENTTATPRWVYLVGYFPADALYTGANNRRMDGLGLEVNKPLDHPKFPLLRI